MMITQIINDTIYATIDGIQYRYNKNGFLDYWCANPCQDWKMVEGVAKKNEVINQIMALIGEK